MTWEEILLADGRLRPAWRFFLSLILIVMVSVGVGIVLGIAFDLAGYRPQFFPSLFWSHLLTLPAYLGVFKLLTTVFEGRPLGSIGIRLHRRWKLELVGGLGLGSLMVLVVAALEQALGLATFSRDPTAATGVLKSGVFFCGLLLIAASNEELAFRGYAFQRLVESIGAGGAIAISSAVFGLGHLINPHHTWLSTLNTALVGILFAVAYLRTRALWLPIGMHFAWNFLMGYALGLPVSGLVIPTAVLKTEARGSVWLTGANYGPEGSLLATVAIVGATFCVLLSRRIYISEEMRELVFGAAPSRVAAGAQGEAPSASGEQSRDRPG